MAALIGFILGLASASLTAERWSEVASAVDELLLCGGFLLPLSLRSGTAADMLGTPQPQTVFQTRQEGIGWPSPAKMIRRVRSINAAVCLLV